LNKYSKQSNPGLPFGEKSRSSLEPAKEIIFPEMTEAVTAGEGYFKINFKF